MNPFAHWLVKTSDNCYVASYRDTLDTDINLIQYICRWIGPYICWWVFIVLKLAYLSLGFYQNPSILPIESFTSVFLPCLRFPPSYLGSANFVLDLHLSRSLKSPTLGVAAFHISHNRIQSSLFWSSSSSYFLNV